MLKKKEGDFEREEWLKREGFQVLRFWNNEFYKNKQSVLEEIVRACQSSPSPSPPPLEGGGNSNFKAE